MNDRHPTEGGRRFIIITVPPPDISVPVEALRREVAAAGKTMEALTYPPHITLRTGAIVPEDRVESYTDAFVAHAEAHRAVDVVAGALVQDTYFSDGKKRHFVGFSIEPSPGLRSLNRHLLALRQFAKSNRQDFHPHLTIAFHDMDAEGAERVAAWLEANPTRVPTGLRWVCDNVGLYNLVEGRWRPFRIATLPTGRAID